MATFELRLKSGSAAFVFSAAVTRVGRADDNDVVMKDAAVSRYHLTFYLKAGQLIVEDAGSANGFLVNGVLVNEPTVLKAGDRLFFGTTEYIVYRDGMAQTARPSASVSPPPRHFGSMATPVSGASVGGGNNRFRLYGALAVVLCVVFFAKENEKPSGKRKPASTADSGIDAMNADGYQTGSPYRKKGMSEMKAENKYREGMREFENKNYARAIISFKEALTMNPSHDLADQQLLIAEGHLDRQISDLLRSADKSYGVMQYRLAKSHAYSALALLSEQIPGYARKLASETPTNGQHGKTQEETLLKLECDRIPKNERAPATVNDSPFDKAAACKKALSLLNKTREFLGDEDVIKNE